MKDNPLKDAPALLAPIAAIYTHRLETHGATAKGVLWQSEDGQKTRFDILAGLLDGETRPVTINDLGCGYGAFFKTLVNLQTPTMTRYRGYDISAEMVAAARKSIPDGRASFQQSLVATQFADYSFASGTFNFKGHHSDPVWDSYIKSSLKNLWSKSLKGMGFNLLDIKGAKPETGLYYADAKDYLSFCRQELCETAELKTANLKDWTIFIRRA